MKKIKAQLANFGAVMVMIFGLAIVPMIVHFRWPITIGILAIAIYVN